MTEKKITKSLTLISTIMCVVLAVLVKIARPSLFKLPPDGASPDGASSMLNEQVAVDQHTSTIPPKALLHRWHMTDIYPNDNTILDIMTESFMIEFYSFKRSFTRPFRNTREFTCSGIDACNYFNGTFHIKKKQNTEMQTPENNSGTIQFSKIAKSKKGCSYTGQPFAPHGSMTIMLSNVETFVVNDDSLVLKTADDQYLFNKEIKGTLVKTQIPNDGGMSIKLDNGEILQLPALQKELFSNYDMYNRTVYMTQIMPLTEMASIYPGTIVSVKTIRFEPSMAFGRPLRSSAHVQKNGVAVQKNDVAVQKNDVAKPHHVLPRLVKAYHTNWTYDLSPSIIKEISSIRDKETFISHWCHAAQHECSSIKSFEQVIKELEHYGAPEWLVIKAHKARFDEIKHTKMALSLANTAHLSNGCATAQTSMVPTAISWQYNLEPINVTLSIRPIKQLVRENYQDACVGEAHAAEQLLKQSTILLNNGKPNLASLLDTMSADESMHAELGHDIDTFLKTLVQ